MPIERIQIGIHQVEVVEFGYGDIGITLSKHPHESTFNLIYLGQQSPTPIGTKKPIPQGTTTDDIEGIRVCLKFDKAESVDAMIRTLKNVKKSLLGNPVKL
jgi:hypothetical protein